MGRIYKFSEIEGKGVPNVNDFLKAKLQVLNGLSNFAEKDIIYGAKIFGSVAKGSPNERSDFDLLVISRDDSEEIRAQLKELFDEVTAQTKVEIEPLVVEKYFAEIGHHTIDVSYLNHIKSISPDGNIAGRDPVVILKPYEFTIEAVHERYLASKLGSLKERYFSHIEEDKYRGLQRALEAPVNTGRRTLQAISKMGFKDDGKQVVVDAFRNIFAGTELMSEFNFILNRDKEYTTFLKNTLNGGISRTEYDAYVNELGKECIPQAISLENKLGRIYLTLLEGSHSAVEGRPSRNRESML